MALSRRLVLPILLVALLLLFGMFYWPFVMEQIITPFALSAWLFLRIFVLSIDQNCYWSAIILVVVVFLFRLPFVPSAARPPGDFLNANDTVRTIEYWRSRFSLTNPNASDETALKRDLIHLLASMYASKGGATPSFTFYEALQRRELPLPDTIHTLLFPEEPKEAKGSLRRLIRSVRGTSLKYLRRWTGQERQAYHRMIDEVLSFMETSMEMENDHGTPTKNKR
jgi:hypothetical protein